MTLHGLVVPHGPGAEAVTARELSCEVLLARGGAISLPVSGTGQSTPMLAPGPSAYTLNWRRLQAAGRNASRPGPPVPIVMVNCDQQDLSCSRMPALWRGYGRYPFLPDAVKAPGKGASRATYLPLNTYLAAGWMARPSCAISPCPGSADRRGRARGEASPTPGFLTCGPSTADHRLGYPLDHRAVADGEMERARGE